MKYLIRVFKPYGPFDYERDTYEDAIALVKDKWFGPGVWDIRLFENGVEIDIAALVRSWGERPIYC